MATSPTPPSSSLPQPLSYQQILSAQLSGYSSGTGINDQNTASANTSFFQITSLMVARASGDIFQIVKDFNLSRATGPALQNLAIEDGVPPLPEKVATGFITVTDLSFQRIATKIYAGLNPPIAGSLTVYVSDASTFPASGAVYLGRGTVNIEGPLPYSAKTQIGSYWSLTLSSPTTRYHNIGESVVLAQGGVRTVPINTIVIAPSVGTTPDILYQVSQTAIILDGETTVNNVPITAQLPGITPNVTAGAISQFSGNPPGLPNASVNNPLAITTGQAIETDEQLRVRVKNKLASTGLGTVTAIESALQGVQSPTSSDTIVSTDILNNSSNTIVYVDNGAGYEATHTGVAIETIVNSALGGEKFFQLVTGGKQTSVTKAFLQTVGTSPFNLSGGEHLVVIVGDITYEHVFQASDFQNPGSATAYEISASINANTTLNFEAVTAGGGTFVVIRPEDEKTNVIQVTTPSNPTVLDANTFLQFPSQKAETLRLYKNNLLLTEDGTTASIFTQSQSLWSPTMASGETLSMSIDGTAPITFTITDAEFVAEGTYVSLSSSNSLQSWVNVLNTNITGITASIVGSTIEITSNLGAVNRAKITVVNTISNPTSLISKGFISNTDLTSTGVQSDYILDRNTAQIQLQKSLVKGDTLSAGTLITRANLTGSTISSGSLTLASDAHVWISIDTSAIIIPTIKSGSTLSVSLVSPNTVRYTTNSPSAFSNVLPGDYVIVWSNELPSGDRLEGRVHAQSGSVLDIKITAAEFALASTVVNASYIQGFVVVRTPNVPQKFRVTSGTKTLQVVAAELQAQTDELVFGVFDNTNLTVLTNTFDVIGHITIVTSDASGAQLGFTGESSSEDALIAFYETQGTTAELPLFFHSAISADSYAEPIDSYLTNFSSALSLSSFDPNELISFLNPYGASPSFSGGPSSGLLTSASSFALLAGSAITNTGASTITGNVGVAPGSSITPGSWTLFGTSHSDDATAIAAQADALSVYTTLSAHSSTAIPAVLDGQTLTSGYYSTGAASLATSGPATLTLSGSSTDLFVIKTASTLVTGAGGTPTITLTGGAVASNVYWVVGSSATINSGTSGVFNGTIIANASITDTLGGTVNGRLLALNGAITLSAASIVTVPASAPLVGSLALVSGTGDATISFSTFVVPVQPLQYTFTVTSANATAGAVYSSNGMFFTVTTTLVSGTTLLTSITGLVDDEQPSEETVQMSAISGGNVTILPEYPDVRRLRVADRYFVANPLDFGYNDTVVAIVDNNTVSETYTMPLYRRAIVNSIYPLNNYSFDAYDVDAGVTASFATNFTGFDFSNFKVLMQAKYVLQGSNAQTALLYRSVPWGRTGTLTNISYVYPTSANQPISSSVTVTDVVTIKIALQSGNPISSLTAASTQWNVTVTPNTPSAGIDQVTYTYSGIGTAPALTLSGGEYTTILPSTGFNSRNVGTFRVSTAVGFTPTSTKFSVQVPTGTALAQSGVVTGTLNGISFFSSSATTAADVNTYVNANLSKYVTSTIVNDGGTTGSGIIDLSSFENGSFATQFYYLKDGINWIASSNVVGNPQFTLKEPLTYPSDTGYSFFTSGDEVRLIPTTMDQVQRLWSILAVTGFTTVGTVQVVDRGTKLQLATNTIGSIGSIQIVGGSGNEYSVPVLTSSQLIGNGDMSVSANSIASQAMASDQWFRLQAGNYQSKSTGIDTNTSVTVLSNTPSGGESTVTLLNQGPSQLYFGGPRKNINVVGDTFRIEKQGSLACLSWNGVGTSPGFSSALNFNDVGGFTVNASSSGTYSVAANTPTNLLNTASSYSILGASAVTSTGATALTGNLGVSPGTAITGFPPGTYTGVRNAGNAAAATAQNDALVAYTTLAAHSSTTIPSVLDGQTLTAGYYSFSSGAATLAASGPGTLTLSGSSSDVFVIKTATTLTTGAGGTPTITLTGGALAKNVYWIVGSSATINSGFTGVFNGNIVAQASITDTLGGTVNGSLIALTGAVTLSAAANVVASGPLVVVSGNANFSSLSIGDLISISGMSNSSNNGTFFVTGVALDGLSFTVSNPLAATETGTPILVGEFTGTTSVSEGDTVILSTPFAPLNQGEFRVIRRFNDSIWYENPNVIEEEVTCTANTISTGFDSSSVFNVTVSGGVETLVWNGTGTPPSLGVALPGDIVTFGAGFLEQYVFTITSGNASVGATYTNSGHTYTVKNTIVSGTTLVCTGTANPAALGTLTKSSGAGDATITYSAFTVSSVNQGSFSVSSSGPSQQQVVQLSMPSGATFASSGPADYFEIYNGGNANQYYVWFNVLGGSNTDPAPGGFTGIQVNVNVSDSSSTVASETNTALAALVAMTHSVSLNVVTVTATVAAPTNSPVNVSMPSAFSFAITQLGQRAFFTVINPSAVAQTAISSVTFSVDRPQIQFFPYEATVPGDKLVVNGSVLGTGNAGTYRILQVLSPTSVVVSGIISQQFANNLAGNSNSVSIEEGTKYTGYKQVLYSVMEPGSANFNTIVFNTSAQYEKINLSANIAMVSLSKLNFPTTIRLGIDSYSFDTGLIGEANRVTYGDPRDPVTYPGNNAAGTNIFIREPLLRRVKIAVSIRTNIGISFAQITNQIQSSVYALILSNPLGQSIALSSIVETIAEIPGVTSVVLTSPTYTVASDEIPLVTGQKAIIISQISDISVSLIGS